MRSSSFLFVLLFLLVTICTCYLALNGLILTVNGQCSDAEVKIVAGDPYAYDNFGISVAIYNKTIVVGNYRDDDFGDSSGSAYVFSELSAGVWTEVYKLVANDAAAQDNFGNSVAIYDKTIVVGASGDSDYGFSSGSTYVFSELSAGVWSEGNRLVASDAATDDYFGFSVAIEDKTIVVGAVYDSDAGSRSGSAYVFSEVSVGVWVQVDKLVASDAAAEDWFGNKVGIYYKTIVVGSYCDDEYCLGAAYIISDTCDDCVGHGCLNGATCIDATPFVLSGTYTCSCVDGFEGDMCENNIDDCPGHGCLNGATCDDITLGYVCLCADGYEGSKCQTEINECLSSPCFNDATCVDIVNDYNCTCADGYEGSECQTEINECLSSPCFNDGACVDIVNDYNCKCVAGYEGSECQTEINECLSSPCFNDATCVDELAGYRCDCSGTGYDGPTCDQDIDDCASSPCQNEGTCQDAGANMFQCICTSYWEGLTCTDNVDDCITNACFMFAVCVDGPYGNYTCTNCTEGYEGEFCDQEIDDCASSPCENGGTCFDEHLLFICDCTDTGYDGLHCDIPIPCFDIVCDNGGTCIENICQCLPEYEGEFCEITIPTECGDTCFSFFVTLLTDEDPESFAIFVRGTLADEIGGDPDDYYVTMEGNDGEYEIVVIYTGADETINARVLEDKITETDGEIATRADIKLDNQEEDTSDDKKEDNTALIIILVFVGVLLLAAGGYFSWRYLQFEQSPFDIYRNTRKPKIGKLAMPI